MCGFRRPRYHDRKPFVVAHSATSRCNAVQVTQSFLSGSSPAQPPESSSAATSSTLFSQCPVRAQVVRHHQLAALCATMPDRRRHQPSRNDAAIQTQTGQVRRIVAIEIRTIDLLLRQPGRHRRLARLHRLQLRLQLSRARAQPRRREFHRSQRNRGVRRPQLLLLLRPKRQRRV